MNQIRRWAFLAIALALPLNCRGEAPSVSVQEDQQPALEQNETENPPEEVRPSTAPPVIQSPEPPRVSPSFDCAKAQSPLEKTICSTPSLCRADRQVADLYATLITTLRTAADEASALREQQRHWLRERQTQCLSPSPDVACLQKLYERQISNFTEQANRYLLSVPYWTEPDQSQAPRDLNDDKNFQSTFLNPGTYCWIAEGKIRYAPTHEESSALCVDVQASQDQRGLMISVGEQTLGPYGRIWNLRFAPSGSHTAFAGIKSCTLEKERGELRGTCQVVVVGDGQESLTYHWASDLALSMQKDHFAYAASEDCRIYFNDEGTWDCLGEHVVIDGRSEPKYGSLYRLSFHPADHFSYIAREGCSWRHRARPADVWRGSPSGRPGAANVVCQTERAVIDGKPSKSYRRIMAAPLFSSDGTHVAFAACEAWHFASCDDGSAFLILDGQRKGLSGSLDVQTIRFGPEGQTIEIQGLDSEGQTTSRNISF
jgi:uncharacterized protein